jgi:hypothetical protein
MNENEFLTKRVLILDSGHCRYAIIRVRNLMHLKSTKYACTYALKKLQICYALKICTYILLLYTKCSFAQIFYKIISIEKAK